jgi:hypothetical protein
VLIVIAPLGNCFGCSGVAIWPHRSSRGIARGGGCLVASSKNVPGAVQQWQCVNAPRGCRAAPRDWLHASCVAQQGLLSMCAVNLLCLFVAGLYK